MPTLNLTFTSETIDGDSFQGLLTDSTVYTTPTRAQGAVYLTGQKMKSDNTEDYPLSITTYNPETVTTFTFDITKDGYNKFKFVYIQDYNPATSYAQYDVVYYDSDNLVYRAIEPTLGNVPTDENFWEPIAIPTSLVDNVGTPSASANLSYQVYERIIYPFSKQGFGTLCSKAALDCCSDCERGEDVLAYEQLGVYVDGMNIADQRGQYLQGEKIARDAQTALSKCL